MLKSYDLKLIRKEYSETTASVKQIAQRHGIKYNTLKSHIYRKSWQLHARTTQYLDRIYNPANYHDLTERQLTFIYLMVYFDFIPLEAYMTVYHCKQETARVNSYRFLRRADIKTELAKEIKHHEQGENEPLESFNMVVSNAFFMANLHYDNRERNRALFECLGL